MHSAESADLEVRYRASRCKNETKRESSFELLVALTTCKDGTLPPPRRNTRDAGTHGGPVAGLHAGSEGTPMRVLIVDEKGHEDDMMGAVKYVGEIPGRSGIWFGIELDPVGWATF